MRSPTSRRLALTLVLACIAACARDAVAPVGLVSRGLRVAHAQPGPVGISQFVLRPGETSLSAAWGELFVFVNQLPPGPCTGATPAAAGEVTISICGVLHNPGDETFDAAVVQFDLGSVAAPIVLSGLLPPDPCRTYRLSGSLTLPAVQVPPSPIVQASFVSDMGDLIAVERNPGPPSSGEGTFTPGTPGDAVSRNPGPIQDGECAVSFTTRTPGDIAP